MSCFFSFFPYILYPVVGHTCLFYKSHFIRDVKKSHTETPFLFLFAINLIYSLNFHFHSFSIVLFFSHRKNRKTGYPFHRKRLPIKFRDWLCKTRVLSVDLVQERSKGFLLQKQQSWVELPSSGYFLPWIPIALLTEKAKSKTVGQAWPRFPLQPFLQSRFTTAFAEKKAVTTVRCLHRQRLWLWFLIWDTTPSWWTQSGVSTINMLPKHSRRTRSCRVASSTLLPLQCIKSGKKRHDDWNWLKYIISSCLLDSALGVSEAGEELVIKRDGQVRWHE